MTRVRVEFDWFGPAPELRSDDAAQAAGGC